MPLEAASLLWLTDDPLAAFFQTLLSRLSSRELLASGLELDLAQAERLKSHPDLRATMERIERGIATENLPAVAEALKGVHTSHPAELFLYFRLQPPGMLEPQLKREFERRFGPAPPADLLELSPLAPYECWACFELGDLRGERRASAACARERRRLSEGASPVWTLQLGAAREPWSSSGALELRTLSEDATYLVFLLEHAGVWHEATRVLMDRV